MSSQLAPRLFGSGWFIVPLLLHAAGDARAEAADGPFSVEPVRGWMLDGGLLTSTASVLPGTMSTGLVVGASRRCGCRFDYGVRTSWSRATGSSMTWAVAHSDLRLRATGGIWQAVGRGTFALRLGLGTNVVHEVRDRTQGERAGLTGDDLRTSAWRALPALDLEAVITLQVAGPWSVVVAGGPSFNLFDSNLNRGVAAQLGIAWQP